MAISLKKRMETNAAHAVELVREMHSIKLPYSEAGIRLLEEVPEWLEGGGGILEEMANTTFLFTDEEPLKALADSFGSYVGEVFRRTYGGRWVSLPDKSCESCALQVGGIKLLPHEKVLKRLVELEALEDPGENNVWTYFQAMRALCGRTKSVARQKASRAANRPPANRKVKRGRNQTETRVEQSAAADGPREGRFHRAGGVARVSRLLSVVGRRRRGDRC